MDAGYCIYFGNKPYFITSSMNERLYALTTWGGTILINQPNAACILSTIHDLDRTDAEAAVILTNKVDHYWSIFREQFEWIEAAGGLVENEKGEWLFIFRREKWDLPKGKLDDGESIDACAIREVEEETGLHHVKIVGDLGKTWHAYHEHGKFCLKQSAWYKMKVTGNQNLVPQTEEDITSIKWLAPGQLDEVMQNTYPSIKEVLNRATSRKS
jgi:8-oxo-dGTP pyrophosphatase MutT (NUDIX family)